MDKIKEILNNIDNIKIGKFNLKKESRIFLKKLLLNENFLKNFISKNGEDLVLKFLNYIYNLLIDTEENIKNIKNYSNTTECDSEVIKIINEYFNEDLNILEEKKENVLSEFIEKEMNLKTQHNERRK